MSLLAVAEIVGWLFVALGGLGTVILAALIATDLWGDKYR